MRKSTKNLASSPSASMRTIERMPGTWLTAFTANGYASNRSRHARYTWLPSIIARPPPSPGPGTCPLSGPCAVAVASQGLWVRYLDRSLHTHDSNVDSNCQPLFEKSYESGGVRHQSLLAQG